MGIRVVDGVFFFSDFTHFFLWVTACCYSLKHEGPGCPGWFVLGYLSGRWGYLFPRFLPTFWFIISCSFESSPLAGSSSFFFSAS